MRRALASGVGVAAALAMVFGSGLAAAINELAGQTYEKAAEQVTNSGASIRIASREGSYLPTEKCIVTGSRRDLSRDSSGRYRPYTVLVDLNCNDTSAFNGHPGNSVTTPQGKLALQKRQNAAFLSEDFAKSTAEGKPSWCERVDDGITRCQNACRWNGQCSAELLDFLGM